MLTVQQVAERLNKTERTIQRWCDRDVFQGARRDGPFKTSAWRVPEADVIAYEEKYLKK